MRIEQLTFFRFLAAIWVVIFHFGRDVFPFNLPYFNNFFKQGDIGVSFFFFLSGFVMIIAYQYKNKVSFVDYMRNRFARIYPVFLLAAMLILLNKIIQQEGHMNLKGLLLNLSMLQAWIPGYQLTYNIASWTLSVELFFYLIFPFLFNRFYTKRAAGLSQVFIAIAAVWVITQLVLILFKPGLLLNLKGLPHLYDTLRFFPLMHLNQFLVGNMVGLLFIRRHASNGRNYDLPIILMLTLTFIAVQLNKDINLFGGLVLIFFAPLVYLIAANNGIITKIVRRRLPVFLGEISYGIYILQFPLYYFTKYWLFYMDVKNNTVIFFATLFILIVFSSASYVLFEKPVRDFLKKKKLKAH
ncbi:acyltransferase [Flavobacterium sp.]|uniref:acyltransferase family protein n=1 Tax=Flavobacterium sp. TaxID=239 RepID=UPI00261CC197|nr:acyltransferase [Flavobacterium sp.]